MFNFLKPVRDYAKKALQSGQYIGQGLAVTFDHMSRRPVTVQYPYEKLIPSERFRGRIHFEFDKCISCEVCVRVCPINLPVVDWEFNKEYKKKELKHYSIDFGVCIFCGNCVEFCPTNCLSFTEEYDLSTYDQRGGGAGGREQGEQSLSRSREAERNMGIKPRPSRAFSIGGSTSSFQSSPLLPAPRSPASFDRHELNHDNVAMGRLPYKVTDDPMVTPLRELVYLPKGILDPHGVPDHAHRPGLMPSEILQQTAEDTNDASS